MVVLLLAGSVSVAAGLAGSDRPFLPQDEAAIANSGSGLERAVLAAKPGAELERMRSHPSARHWGWALAAAVALIALAPRPRSFQRLPVVASRLRADYARVRPSRAPPGLLLIQS